MKIQGSICVDFETYRYLELIIQGLPAQHTLQRQLRLQGDRVSQREGQPHLRDGQMEIRPPDIRPPEIKNHYFTTHHGLTTQQN